MRKEYHIDLILVEVFTAQHDQIREMNHPRIVHPINKFTKHIGSAL